MTLPVYVAFDPGSARMGAVAGHWTAPALTVIAAQKIAVALGDDGVIEAAAQAIEFALAHNAAGIIIERGQLYMPAGVTPQAATQIARAHAIMCRVADLIEALARARRIPVERVPRASWAHRIIPHHRGGITDAMVLAALPGHVDPAGCALLVSKDLRDAAGALLWHFIPETPRKRRSRARVVDPNKPVVPRVVYTGADATIEAKAKRQRDRALFASRKKHGTVERLSGPCNCGVQHGKGRRPRTCSQAPPSKVVPTPPKRPLCDPVTGLFRREQDVLTALASAGPSMPGELTTRALPSAGVYLPKLAARGFCVRLPDGRYAPLAATQDQSPTEQRQP